MASRLRPAWVALAFLSSVNLPPARTFAVEEKAASPPAATDEVLRRCGYRPSEGAQVLGKPVASPSGEDFAFFEQHAARYELVVCMHGASPARWLVNDRLARMKIFWVGRTEIVLGYELLQPTARVKWEVARM